MKCPRKFNYCATQLKEQVCSLEDFPVFSIRLMKRKTEQFIYPSMKVMVDEIKYPPVIRRSKGGSSPPHTMEKNNLGFFGLRRKGKGFGIVGEWFIDTLGTRPEKPRRTIPSNHILEVDTANKRLRLIGRKNNQGWIRISYV